MNRYVHASAGLAVAVIMGAAGCSQQSQEARENGTPVGMANPASQYCEKKGGKVLMEKDREGNQRGICHLPDGERIDEWVLFRRDHPERNN